MILTVVSNRCSTEFIKYYYQQFNLFNNIKLLQNFDLNPDHENTDYS